MKSKKLAERGQALIIIALAGIALVAIVGLAIDGSNKFSDMRHAQNAADTAVLAGALSMVNGDTAWKVNALDRALSNGYDNNLTTNTVEVYSCNETGSSCGPYAGQSNYVQVIINSYVNTFFARVIGVDQTHNRVQAVSITREGGALAEGAMIISYDPDPNCSTGGEGGYSLLINGTAEVNLWGGGLLLNSDEVCGFKIPNCADLNIHSGSINSVADNIDIPEGCTLIPPPDTNIDPSSAIMIPDDVRWPDVPPECNTPATAYNNPPGSNTWHITPGAYTDFPQSTLNGDIVGNKKDIVMDSGVYCVSKDIKWSGNTFDSLDGSSGVTIYMKSGADFSLNLDSPITLNAPTSGDYQGYLVIQEGTHTDIGSCIINGGGYLDINGLIYAPYCDFTINGQAGETAQINAQIVGWTIKINGNNAINFNYDPSNEVIISSQVGLMK
ncbi:MAG TPA: Tad domain-containing protein [Anaerolineales bacterium]|nr:Tad domain-containing protein [Anaerolineales bacterium]